MPLDPARVVSATRGAPRRHRRRERRPARRLDRDLGAGAGDCSRTRSPTYRSRCTATRPATTGTRSAARSDEAVLIGGHLDSVPNGGWLDGCLNVLAGAEVLRRIAEDGHASGHRPARRLGRRGGRTLRQVAVRLVRGRRLDGRSGRAPQAHRPRRGHPPRRRRGLRRRPRPRARGTLRARRRGGLPRAPYRARTGPRVARACRSAQCSGPSASSVIGSAGRGRPRTQARHRWTSAATRSPARRSSLSRSARSRPRQAAARCARRAVSSAGPGIVTSVVETAEQLLDQRHLDGATLAAMLAHARSLSERFADEEHLAVEWERIWSIEPILFDERLDRVRRRGDHRGRRNLASASLRAVARRGRGLAGRGSRR